MSRFSRLAYHLPLGEAVRIYFSIKRGKYHDLKVSKLRYPFSMRDNPYDYATFEEVLVKESYNIPIHFIPETIIDGGGNIGLTAAYFATKYPRAAIVSFEPDQDNFSLLQRNIAPYKNVQAIRGGIWNRAAHLIVKDTGTGNNGFIVEEADENQPGAIPSWGISDIMKKMSWTHLDLLKLDVEGSEKEIFSGNYESWLPRTRLLVVELHDRMKKGTSNAVFSAISNYNFSCAIAGENLVFTNEAFVL